MKKTILGFLGLMTLTTFVFAEDLATDLSTKIAKSNSFCTSASDTENQTKPRINYTYQSADEFTAKVKENYNKKIFTDAHKVKFNDIKTTLKNGHNIFAENDNEFVKIKWVDGVSISYAVIYKQNKTGPIYGAGLYQIYAFENNTVYTITLKDSTNTESINPEYDILGNYFVFRNGKISNAATGEAGTQGYYFITLDAPELFYTDMLNMEVTIPSSAKSFQNAEIFIESVLANH